MEQEEIKAIIKAELTSTLSVLIDPKKKDSFSEGRINAWKNLVTERLYYHLYESTKPSDPFAN